MEARHLLKELKETGWYLGQSESGCRQYVQKEQPHVITVCVRYNDELGPATRASLEITRDPAPGGEREVVVETTRSGFSAYSPQVPGAIATGDSEAEVRDRLDTAIALQLRTVREQSSGTG